MSNPFTKTIIVDTTHPVVVGEYYQTIGDATQYFITYSIDGGTIIVEQGTYEIDGTTGKDTIEVPSNVTIIGRGNAVINVTANVSAFKATGADRITISGFKIEQNCSSGVYTQHLIYMKEVNNSVIENNSL